MNTKAISYLILLMDSLGMNINSGSVKSFWSRIAEIGDDSNHPITNHYLDGDILEPMVYLWEASRRSRAETAGPQKIKSGAFPGPSSPGFGNENPKNASDSSKALDKLIVENEDLSKLENSLNPEIHQSPEVSGRPQEPSRPNTDGIHSDIELTGRYLYGLVRGTPGSFTAKGIDQAPVRLIWYKDLGAITHSCVSAPYQSNDRDQVTGWLKRHEQILELANDKFNDIVPIGFDTILDGSKANDPDEIVVNWLTENYDSMIELAQKLAGKVEYGIRIACLSEKLVEIAKNHNPAIQRLVKKMAGMKPGTAYLYRTELDSLIRSSVNEVRGLMTRELLEKLKNVVVDIKEGSITKKFDESGAEVIANLAVLTEPAKADDLGTILEDFQNRLQVRVIFTGPWPGYSFVNDTRIKAQV
jgi:hypothetical protein